MQRCPWCEGFELYRHYHDTEWGVPLRDDRALFELIGGGRQMTEVYAGIFIVGRLAHAVGLSMKNTSNILRVLGTVITIGVCVVLGVRLVMMGLPLLLDVIRLLLELVVGRLIRLHQLVILRTMLGVLQRVLSCEPYPIHLRVLV